MKIDFKKTEKELYLPKTKPSIIDVPEMTFITVAGKGDPNNSAEYIAAVQLLYGLSYTIKMGNKDILDYVVPPLEGLWTVDGDFKGGGATIDDKSKFIWTMMIRQPDFVTTEIFEAAKITLAKKKPVLDVTKAKIATIDEGLCVQAMHIGPYDDEAETVVRPDDFAIRNGYALDINDKRQHHEIYISDPRRTAPERLKTVLRHPIRRMQSIQK